jgi:hypothetical protein
MVGRFASAGNNRWRNDAAEIGLPPSEPGQAWTGCGSRALALFVGPRMVSECDPRAAERSLEVRGNEVAGTRAFPSTTWEREQRETLRHPERSRWISSAVAVDRRATVSVAFSLVPKLYLGTPLSPQFHCTIGLCPCSRNMGIGNRIASASAFPNRVWERGELLYPILLKASTISKIMSFLFFRSG